MQKFVRCYHLPWEISRRQRFKASQTESVNTSDFISLALLMHSAGQIHSNHDEKIFSRSACWSTLCKSSKHKGTNNKFTVSKRTRQRWKCYNTKVYFRVLLFRFFYLPSSWSCNILIEILKRFYVFDWKKIIYNMIIFMFLLPCSFLNILGWNISSITYVFYEHVSFEKLISDVSST